MPMIHPLLPTLGFLAFLLFAFGGGLCINGLKPWKDTHTPSENTRMVAGFIMLLVGIALSFILTAYIVVVFCRTVFGG